MSQSRSTAFPKHRKKERWGTNNDKTNITYDTTDAQTNNNCNREQPLIDQQEKKQLPDGGTGRA